MIGTSAFNHSRSRLRTVAASAVLASALAHAMTIGTQPVTVRIVL